MPIVRTTLLEGFATADQRSELVSRLADTVVDVFGPVTKPYIFSIVEEVMPGTWSIGGQVANEDMIQGGRAASQAYLATKVTADRVDAAYDALAGGGQAEIEEYWDQEIAWLVPGESRVSGLKTGLSDFLNFMKLVGELSEYSFNMERTGCFVSGDQTIDLSHNTGTRAGDPSRQLNIDVAHLLTWRDGKVVEG
ncbi:MAG TPA: nuclear transport factor 2 family protein, partial [Pseudonocardiaceae bacterium]|nr:nuclear transport factor 2 family protein [Pseudonocardiaceae bacterium]